MGQEGVRAEARVTTRPTEDEIETWHAFYEFWRRMHQFWHDEALEFNALASGEFVRADVVARREGVVRSVTQASPYVPSVVVDPTETAILELIRKNKLIPPPAPTAPTPPEAAATSERFFFCTSCGRNRPWRLQRDPWRGAKCSECYAKDVRR